MERLSGIIAHSLGLICTEGKSVKSAVDDTRRLAYQFQATGEQEDTLVIP
jgi:hypothetical protein